ncbi:hypothetical protein ACIGLI_18905 [Bacillus subtilis]|uniref:hypothetical protein n=1 Tax=Bacillus TaxID=1386 RepID=UPI000EFC2BE7|nr:hypothetical protein [Bacillus subtilis]MBJ3767542.1 hypothetical protein [Bacillus subtilis]MDI6684863.1 hypothetical protein [Bacillus subtilis]MEC2267419.1 hypothetical protein [Bacillus subtilis]MED3671412.1 hypothetical protein [Bacillus subtilis]MED4456556.1 hypothetical protein [Bacillus subtilis]
MEPLLFARDAEIPKEPSLLGRLFLCEKVFAGNVMPPFGHSYNMVKGVLRWEHEQLFD